MASSYSFPPIDNDSSRSYSPSNLTASPLGGISRLFDEPVADTEIDVVDDPLLWQDPEPGPEPSEYACSSAGDPSDFEGDDAFLLAPVSGDQSHRREASAAEDTAYWQPGPSFGGVGALLPRTSVLPPTNPAPPHTTAPYHPSEAQQASTARPHTPPNQLTAPHGTQSTPVIGKPSATQEHSFKDPTDEKFIKRIRRAYAMELQGRISQVSLDTFMAEFVPGPDIPPGVTTEPFNPSSFKREGKTMYNELVSGAQRYLAHSWLI